MAAEIHFGKVAEFRSAKVCFKNCKFGFGSQNPLGRVHAFLWRHAGVGGWHVLLCVNLRLEIGNIFEHMIFPEYFFVEIFANIAISPDNFTP